MAGENEIQQEIDAIRNDSDHPFNHGDEKALAHVENLYKKLYGGEPVMPPEPRIEGEVSAEEEWELRAEIEQERQKREGEIDQKAVNQTIADVRWRLEQEWGAEAPKNWQIVNDFSAKMNGADFQRLALGLDSELKAEWVKLLYKTATATRRR